MALTLSSIEYGRNGRKHTVTGQVAFDSSYPTNGESFTVTDLGIGTEITDIDIRATSGYVFEFDYTNKKIKAFYGDNNNASDGALIEVPNTTDLSAVTGVRFRAEVV